MANYTPSTGFDYYTGALSKRKQDKRITVTRIKSVKDPLTAEVVSYGKKEIYVQERRDYDLHPLTDGEQKQRSKWTEACKQASRIIHDKSHPRYMEMYERWRAHLSEPGANMQFPNFVRAFLASE